MRKILILFFIATFCLCSVAFAAPNIDEVNALNEKFQDAKYKLESGVNFRDFSAIASDLHISSSKFIDKYPDEQISKEFKKVSRLYQNCKNYWSKSITSKYKPLMPHEKMDIITFYPDIAKNVHLYDGDWYPEFAKDAVFNAIPAYQADLNKYIADNYKH